MRQEPTSQVMNVNQLNGWPSFTKRTNCVPWLEFERKLVLSKKIIWLPWQRLRYGPIAS